jgi:hypothetical protein
MQVQITKQEGYKPNVVIRANTETAYDVATIDEWIRNLRLARTWLAKMKTAK